MLLAIEKALKAAEKKKGEKSNSNGTSGKRRRGKKSEKSGLDNAAYDTADIVDLSSRYYTLIPHVFSFSRKKFQEESIIRSRKKLNQVMIT